MELSSRVIKGSQFNSMIIRFSTEEISSVIYIGKKNLCAGEPKGTQRHTHPDTQSHNHTHPSLCILEETFIDILH